MNEIDYYRKFEALREFYTGLEDYFCELVATHDSYQVIYKLAMQKISAEYAVH